MAVFVSLNSECDGFGQVGEWMGFILANFSQHLVESRDSSVVFGFCPQWAE